MVAPSFVTVTSRPLPVDCNILSYAQKVHPQVNIPNIKTEADNTFQIRKIDLTIPFGPRVVITKSAIAIAPMNEA